MAHLNNMKYTLTFVLAFFFFFNSLAQIDVEIIQNDTVVCSGSQLKFKGQTVLGSPSMRSWKWVTPNGVEPFSSSSDSFSVVLNFETAVDEDTAITYIIYSATDLTFSDQDTIEVRIIDGIDLNLLPDHNTCCDLGDLHLPSIALTSNSPLGGIWSISSNPNWLSDSILHADNACNANPTEILLNYSITSSTTSCQSTGQFKVIVNPLPSISLYPLDPEICESESNIILNANPSGGTWSSSDPNSLGSSTFSPSSAVKDQTISLYYDYTNQSTGCSNTDSIKTITRHQPTLSLPPDTNLYTFISTDYFPLGIKADVEHAQDLIWSSFSLKGGSISLTKHVDSAQTVMDITDTSSYYRFFVHASTTAHNVCPAATDEMFINIYHFGLSVPEYSSSFSIYPNPSSGYINISSNNGVKIESISLINQLGQHVYHTEVDAAEIRLSSLSPGIYTLLIKQSDKFYAEKLIIR